MVFDLATLEANLMHPEADLSYLSGEEQFARITAKAGAGESLISADDLRQRFIKSKQTGEPLKIKLGIDPTGADVHIGHAIPLLMLNRFRRMGHRIQFVIGDFTAMIGDPGERMDSRPALTKEDVQRNMQTYQAQASHVLDFTDPKVEVHFNSTWLSKINMTEWLQVMKKLTINSMIQRDDFRQRLANGAPLTMAEISYSILQAYDSVILQPDVELGGFDQCLNLHFCRKLMELNNQRPENFLCNDLLPGTTGELDQLGRMVKMSKSRGNYIPITAEPADMYGKVMSIPDDVMWIWYRELTEITNIELTDLRHAVETDALHPKLAKQLLAKVVVATFNHYDSELAETAAENFNSKFGKSKTLVPSDCNNINIQTGERLLDTLARAHQISGSELKRLAEQNGLKILQADTYLNITPSQLMEPASNFAQAYFKVGKRSYYHLI